jgi:hypothetical protein
MTVGPEAEPALFRLGGHPPLLPLLPPHVRRALAAPPNREGVFCQAHVRAEVLDDDRQEMSKRLPG